MDDTNTIFITDDNGHEKMMEIVLTFDNEDGSRHFTLITDPEDEEGNVYAYQYFEDGRLEEVTDEEDIEMCAEVLGAFQETQLDGSEA